MLGFFVIQQHSYFMFLENFKTITFLKILRKTPMFIQV